MLKSDIKSKDKVLLRFMEKTIDNINTCLASQYTLYKLLIDKKLITESKLISRLKEDRNLPQRKMGMKVLKEMLAPDWEQSIDFEKTEQNILEHIYHRIYSLVLPPHWATEEGVEPPNDQAKKGAYKICHDLYKKQSLQPTVIACTKENGIYLTFKKDNKSLIIEVYNDGDIGALVNNDEKKEILYNEDIKDYNFDTCITILSKKI